MKKLILSILTLFVLVGCRDKSNEQVQSEQDNRTPIAGGIEDEKLSEVIDDSPRLYNRQDFATYDANYDYFVSEYGEPMKEQINFEIVPGQSFKMDTFYDTDVNVEYVVGVSDIAVDSEGKITFVVIRYPEQIDIETALSNTVYLDQAKDIILSSPKEPYQSSQGSLIIYQPVESHPDQKLNAIYIYDAKEYQNIKEQAK